MNPDIVELIKNEVQSLSSNDEKINYINDIKVLLHELSPFKNQPVDCVIWVKNDLVTANDYNPNAVAPPEMELLELSIDSDGYTQPIVSWKNENKFEVVDGFHRNRVGKESKSVRNKVYGYLPVTVINDDRIDRNNRISSTIRHNRARGKHKVDSMSEIVIELKNRNWSNERICRELGMEQDEILRLCQITGLAELFTDQEFSMSWDITDSEDSFEELTDEITIEEKDFHKFRTVNTNDENRIFHTYKNWECFKAGFYNTSKNGRSRDEYEREYAEFLKNEEMFRYALDRVINEWKYSCEHYLTNASMNRIAYLGQAAACYAKGLPSIYRAGFHLLSEEEQLKANMIALEYLNKWLEKYNRTQISLEEAIPSRQSTIY